MRAMVGMQHPGMKAAVRVARAVIASRIGAVLSIAGIGGRKPPACLGATDAAASGSLASLLRAGQMRQ